MARTITVDIINEKAMNLLRDLESLKLIRLHYEEKEVQTLANAESIRFKGAMTKQSINDVNQQLKELRNDWE
jgi:hypothetical protein